MTSKSSFTKAALLLGGASILAVAIGAQPRQNSSGGNPADIDWITIRYQTSGATGGTTTGTTGGSGGVITGATPRALSEVVVTNPSLFVGPNP